MNISVEINGNGSRYDNENAYETGSDLMSRSATRQGSRLGFEEDGPAITIKNQRSRR